ncbi:MAG: hypothetical protein KUG77_23275 [Nannocystaceae bacterium]|nr:hypothetical protein [Nannocystaceae bacterium]
MLDTPPPPASPSTVAPAIVEGTPIEQSLQAVQPLAALWRSRVVDSMDAADPTHRWLAAVPDVGPTCEVILADTLLHDLGAAEKADLLRWIRGTQDASGAWLSTGGSPDLSLTVLGWWARRCGGDDPADPSMVRAQRVVRALGGAQRTNFEVRLWLALCGAVPWDFLPAIPGELFLLPRSMWVSPSRVAPWARGVLTPYYVLARAGARLRLPDPSPLMLRRDPDASMVCPRLTRPGLAGDLLQAFDRTVKLSQKLPRGPLRRRAVARAVEWIDATRQRHGGWFSTRPTLLSLLALRVQGATEDDPRVIAGLAHVRASRGHAVVRRGIGKGEIGLVQGLGGTHVATAARLVLAQGTPSDVSKLLRMELSTPGPWQDRANALAGGWPHEPGTEHHLDLDATCNVLAVLGGIPEDSPLRTPAWAARRRATDMLLAMQERAGGFARFERGEASVFLGRFPWADGDLLAMGNPSDPDRVRLAAHALAHLGHTGFRIDDDRVARGIGWLRNITSDAYETRSIATLSGLASAAVATCPPSHPMRHETEHRLRARQREDGSFGDLVATAQALSALLELSGPCVQCHRAARHLAEAVARHGDDLDLASQASCQGLGLSPRLEDPSATAREVSLALRAFVQRTRGAAPGRQTGLRSQNRST